MYPQNSINFSSKIKPQNNSKGENFVYIFHPTSKRKKKIDYIKNHISCNSSNGKEEYKIVLALKNNQSLLQMQIRIVNVYE